MSIIQISKIQQRAGNLVDLPQLDNAQLGWATDARRLFIGRTGAPFVAENVEVITSYSNISFTQIDGSYGTNLSLTNAENGQILGIKTIGQDNFVVNKGGNAGGLVTLGTASNVKITGGAIGYVLQTDGTGNLSWTPKGYVIANIQALSNATPIIMTVANTTPFTNGTDVTITGVAGANANTIVNSKVFYVKVANDYPTSGNVELYTNAGLTVPADGTNLTATPNTGTATFLVASSGGIAAAGGSQGSVQYNNSGVIDGSSNLVLSGANLDLVGTFTAGNIFANSGTISSGNLIITNRISAGGNIIGGNLIGIFANGNSSIRIPAANGNITMGAAGNATVVVVTGTGANINGTLSAGLISASGNITGANLSTSGTAQGGYIYSTGNMSATGNITGANLITGGLITAMGNITGANLSTSGTAQGGYIYSTGNMSATGNITGANLVTGGVLSATGNITGANLVTGGVLSATGNITGANLVTGGVLSATGNITGANIITMGSVGIGVSSPSAKLDIMTTSSNTADVGMRVLSNANIGLEVIPAPYTGAYNPSVTANSATIVGRGATIGNGSLTLTAWSNVASSIKIGSDGNTTLTGNATVTGTTTLTGVATAPTAANGTSNTQIATTAFVMYNGVPRGCIMLWSGSIGSIPSGWYLCNGTNGTPNLIDRFIVSAGGTYPVGAVGGSADAIVVSHNHTASFTSPTATSTVNDPGHAHITNAQRIIQNGGGISGRGYGETGADIFTATTGITVYTSLSGGSVTVNATGSSGTNANMPPYYALAYIMKA
jgi:hypothetical protein